MRHQTTREQIIEAADGLFYQQGYEHTSFSEIAKTVGISRGNFYYHFKSKDEILDAVINLRMTNTKSMLEQWENEGERPEERIRCFIRILITNWSKIEYYGCPVGTLTAELAKLNHASLDEASKVFTLFRTWLREQFIQLGHAEDADTLAMQVLAFSQGVAALASAFKDERFVRQEVQRMCAWLDSLSKQGGQPNVHHPA
ncbi:TetR/AcrR family transcriptional regulator [Halomonas sp. M4R5S39]|uniref:TetR/AcrR family transcriptional regulator n=1 Tax=Halomonas kalidii TaxID=3043293 RepID=UPI0024A98211|nr:TetR/AcrR family transcriptional regulator [Halomonas kalidii]MDI5985424.1 TetR/AcrR family transcriptional regulator [Halomonas kalidii]